MRSLILVQALLLTVTCAVQAQTTRLVEKLSSIEGLELHNVSATPQLYRGKRAVHVLEQYTNRDAHAVAIVKGSSFGEGTIEIDVAGAPVANAPEGSRGFIGIAFHVQGPRQFRSFYLRPTNGRAEDQLRRNHATQYINEPDFPWERLRKEEPGVYESYVDLEVGVWTRIKVVVTAKQAKLFVNGATQPTLVINDLKPGEAAGKVALWIGSGTDAYFANLSVQ